MFLWNVFYFIQIIPLALGQQLYPRPYWNNKNVSAKRINEPCDKTEECRKSDYNTFCDMRYGSTCQCSIGFRIIGDKCLKECQDDEDCQTNDSNSICQLKLNICGCRKSYIRRRGKCIKAKKLGEPCDNTEECKKGDKNSRCTFTQGSQYTTCECNTDYPYLKEKCQKVSLYNQRCSDNIECLASDSNTACIITGLPDIKTCLCLNGYSFSSITNHCVYDSNNVPSSKKIHDTATLTAIIGTVTCVAALLISLFLCAYRQRRESQLRSRPRLAQTTNDAEESLSGRDSTLRRSIRSFLARIGQAPPYTDPPPPYDLVVAQKSAITNQDNPPSYNDIFQTSHDHTNLAFVPDPGPSYNI